MGGFEPQLYLVQNQGSEVFRIDADDPMLRGRRNFGQGIVAARMTSAPFIVAEGERRVCTILFRDVKGSTAIAGQLDPGTGPRS